jgi:hypothetical protein
VFNTDPLQLSANQFARLYTEAMFIKQLDQEIMKRSVIEALHFAFANKE